ncbi:poly(A)-specific ribonuclease, partial [Rhizopus azygosporus]
IGIRINNCELTIKALPVGKEIPPEFKESPEKCAIYELSGTILQVQADEDLPHLLDQDAKTPWYLFNDFLVHKIRPEEVYSFKGTWKTPAVIQYTRVNLDNLLDLSMLPSETDYSLLFKDLSIAKEPNPDPQYEVLSPDEMPKKGTLVAIDAEFVALQQEETEIRSDGTKSLIRPSTLTLARVSVLRGDDGPKEGVPFIDDYISTTEPIIDYLTEFSGIVAGDLDAALSKRTLVPLKVAYKKLRMLVDLGCIFIGHGLNKDFRIINLLVPPEQIIDTVDIYHIRNRQRKISLRFLAWHLLNQDIQLETHDSIEDARTALTLYKKYLEYKNNGTFGKVLEEIYDAGHKSNWLKGAKEVKSISSAEMATGKLRRKVMQDFFKEKQINKTEWICCQITYTCIADIGRHVNEAHVDDLDKMEEKELERFKQQQEQQKIISALRQRRGEKGSSDPIRTDCDCNVDEHKVILFYRYVSIDDPVQFALDHHQYCQGMRGKVRIGQEGINATLAGPNEDIDTYLNWLTHTAPFRDTPDELKVPQPLTERDSPRYRFFKPSKGCKHVFAELSIKVVDEICPLGQTSVALDHLQDPAHRQGKLSPQDFHHILSRRHEDDFLLLDTRNYYESKIGYFEGAIKPAIRKFSQFPDYINRNKEVMRGKKILTYCTGGIR